jgi:hypothetical protein
MQPISVVRLHPSGMESVEREAPISSVIYSAPVSASQMRTVLSSEPEASRLPSPENATDQTQDVWPSSVVCSAPSKRRNRLQSEYSMFCTLFLPCRTESCALNSSTSPLLNPYPESPETLSSKEFKYSLKSRVTITPHSIFGRI